MWDGHPDFYSKGRALFCEDVGNYTKSPIKARVSRQIVADYMGKLGFPVLLPEFWTSCEDAVYVSRAYAGSQHAGAPIMPEA